MTGQSYNEGFHDGMRRALEIVKATDGAPNTRCSRESFGAARRRIVRVLAGALERNRPCETCKGTGFIPVSVMYRSDKPGSSTLSTKIVQCSQGCPPVYQINGAVRPVSL